MIQGIIQILSQDTKIIKALGHSGKSQKVKIYPVLCDQDENTPYVVLVILGNNPNRCKDSNSVLDEVRFEATTYAKDYTELDTIDHLIRLSLDGYKGVSCGIDLDVWFETHRDGFDSNAYYARISQYSAFVKRSV